MNYHVIGKTVYAELRFFGNALARLSNGSNGKPVVHQTFTALGSYQEPDKAFHWYPYVDFAILEDRDAVRAQFDCDGFKIVLITQRLLQ